MDACSSSSYSASDNVLGKAMEDGLSIGDLVIHMEYSYEASGFDLSKPWQLWPSEELTSKLKITFPSVCHF